MSNRMTEKEAIDGLKRIFNEYELDLEICGIKQDSLVIRDMAISALEKQIPREPINKTKTDNGVAKHYENCNVVVCPSCAGRLKLKSKGNYCDNCGQAIK